MSFRFKDMRKVSALKKAGYTLANRGGYFEIISGPEEFNPHSGRTFTNTSVRLVFIESGLEPDLRDVQK